MANPTGPENTQDQTTRDDVPTQAPIVETAPETTESHTSTETVAESGHEPGADESAAPVAPVEPVEPVEPVAPEPTSVAGPAPAAPSAPSPVHADDAPTAELASIDADRTEAAPTGASAVVPSAPSPTGPAAPSIATPVEPVAPVESVVPSVPSALEPVAPSASSPAESVEPAAPSAATPVEPVAPVEPAVPSAFSMVSAQGAAFDDDDVPYQPRVYAFARTGAIPVVPAAPVGPHEPLDARPSTGTEPWSTHSQPVEDAQATQVLSGPDPQATQAVPAVEETASGVDTTAPYAPVATAWTSAATSAASTPTPPTAVQETAAPTRTPLSAAFTPVGAPEPAPAGPSEGGSPLDGLAGDKAPSRLPKVALWAGIGVVVLGGLYTGAQWFYADKVPAQTTVAGVEVGGLDTQAAAAALEKGLGGHAKEPITLQAGASTTTLDPATAGLGFDAQATADELTSFSMSPVRLWKHVFGGADEAPVTTVDDAKLDAQVTELAARLALDPVDGNVVFTDGQPVATAAQDGAEIVEDEARDIISSSWLTAPDPLELPTTSQAPDITQEETDAALAQAQTVVSAPVTVAVGGQEAELTPDVLASAATFNPTEGALHLAFDGPTLLEAVVGGTDDLLDEAADAKFVFANGVPTIEGGAPGTTIDPVALASAVSTAALGTDRTATVELVQTDPAQSVAALEALGVKEKISEFSTPLTNDALRTENLRVGASKVNGTLIKPGETFSLVETLSPITTAGGYHSSGIVQDGKHVEGIGGGLSQMATTTYNAGFFAGFEDVEHRQHSYWFTRYPAGREATIFVGSIDMKFKNDSPYGALMQSWVAGGQLHVAIWSTKHFEVQTTSSGQQNVVQPTTVTHAGADCVPQPMGNPGFSITTYRKVLLDGKVVKDEKDTWRYKPDNAVTCGP
ncbi:VanW family protein [Oerskovia turbata]